MTKYIASFLTALIVSSDAAASLRAKNDSPETEPTQRRLQILDTNVFNALVNEFTPDLSGLLQTELAAFDPLVLGAPVMGNLGDVTFEGACPGSYANITYGIGTITGISNVDIQKIELIDGSQDIEVSFLGLDGATWGADWLFDFSFPAVLAETTVVLEASLCGFPVNQAMEVTATISNPAIVSTVRMNGETTNLIFFGSSSQVTSAVVQTLDMSIGNVTADFGVDGNVVQNLNIAESLQQQVLTTLSDSIEPLMLNVANALFASLVPLPLLNSAGSNAAVSKSGFDLP